MPPVEKKPSDERKKLGDADEVLNLVGELEEQLAHLKASFEQYFLGVERRPPTDEHEKFKRGLRTIKGTFVRHTGANFKVQGLSAKYLTYERLWSRTLKEIEDGTYRRDLFKARRKHEKPKKANGVNPDATPPETDPLGAHPEDAKGTKPVPPIAEQVTAPVDPPPALAAGAKLSAKATLKPGELVAPKSVAVTVKPGELAPARPVGVTVKPGEVAPAKPAAGPPPKPVITAAKPVPPGAAPAAGRAPVAAEGDLSEKKIKAIYDAYVMAKKRCNEDVSKLSVDTLASTLRKQVPELMKQHGAKSVEFKVVIKDGKAILRALPKTGE